MTPVDLEQLEGRVKEVLRDYRRLLESQGKEDTSGTGYPYNPARWDEAIFAERFLFPLCHPNEARSLRAFGRFLFHRSLEYSHFVDRGESRITADLRGAMRDLFLVARFVEAVGTSFRDSEVHPADHPQMHLAAQLAPAIEAIAQRLETELPLVAASRRAADPAGKESAEDRR